MKTKNFLKVASLIIIFLIFNLYSMIKLDLLEKNNVDSETEPSVSLSTLKQNDTIIQSYNKQIYDTFLNFPYDNMKFASSEIFELIKEVCDGIEFYGKFNLGNIEVYDYYKEKYNQLLKNERIFTYKKTGEELYLSDFGHLKVYNDSDKNDLNKYVYYFFDMDEDESPELCISDFVSFNYIFKYDPDSDKFILWYEMDTTWLRLNGSKKIRWNREGIRHMFYQLDKNGEEEYFISFFSREALNKKTNQAEVIYMISLPRYFNKDKQIEMTEKIKNQAYFDEGQSIYYFRVTEEQYDILTKDYFKAQKLAEENIKKISFTYKELFEDF